MTMVRLYRCFKERAVRAAGFGLGVALATLVSSALLAAQKPSRHFLYRQGLPPGAIGKLRLQRGGPLSGYLQPVEIKAPHGALVSMAEQGRFGPPLPTPQVVGLLISPVYRFQVTQIPGHEGLELFPTIEIVDRLYPPRREVWRFPISVQLTQSDLELALDGKFVTRVIYLEDPEQALPQAEDPQQQNWFEVEHGQDPLAVADGLGRPVAILRIGGLLPGSDGPDERFLFGSPPLVRSPAEQQ